MAVNNEKMKEPSWQLSDNPVKPVTIILAFGQYLVRAGVRSLLQDTAGIQVVAETNEGQELLRLITVNLPDIVLTDNAVSGLNESELLRKIRHDFPGVRTMILSCDASEESVCRAFRSGVSAYVLNDIDGEELCLAIRSAMRGAKYLGTSVPRPSFTDILSAEQHAAEEPVSGTDALESLSPRHREILRMIVEGVTLKKIARHLNLSVKTVEVYRRQIMDRLGIQTIGGLVRYAMRSGIIR